MKSSIKNPDLSAFSSPLSAEQSGELLIKNALITFCHECYKAFRDRPAEFKDKITENFAFTSFKKFFLQDIFKRSLETDDPITIFYFYKLSESIFYLDFLKYQELKNQTPGKI